MLWFIVGLVMGANIGLFICALLIISKKSDQVSTIHNYHNGGENNEQIK